MPASEHYRVPLDRLATRVPLDDQVTEQPEPPGEAPIAAEELDRQRLLGITGAGTLHPR